MCHLCESEAAVIVLGQYHETNRNDDGPCKSLANSINRMPRVVNLSFTEPPWRLATVSQCVVEQSLDKLKIKGMMTSPGGSVSSHNPAV